MRTLWVVLLLLAPLAGGCGSPYKLAPVSGKVTIDSQPGANCQVTFEPIGSQSNPNPGPQSLGKTDDQGVFTLQTFPDKYRGAVVGKCRVRIIAMSALGPEMDEDYMLRMKLQKKVGRPGGPPKQLPSRYNMKTELTFEVPPSGTDSANFDLKSQ